MGATEYKEHLAAIKAIYNGRRKFAQVLNDYHLRIQEEAASGLRDNFESEAHRAWATDKYMWDQFVVAKECPFPWADPAPPRNKLTGKRQLQATANYKNYPAILVTVQCGCQKNASNAKTDSYAATVSSTTIFKAENDDDYNCYSDLYGCDMEDED